MIRVKISMMALLVKTVISLGGDDNDDEGGHGHLLGYYRWESLVTLLLLLDTMKEVSGTGYSGVNNKTRMDLF